ncbi:MAG: NHL repeat-containing protein [Desulfovibrionales bacterium]|nr:NHL repeat-containing protein [Desulfovibrionales bacterium]
MNASKKSENYLFLCVFVSLCLNFLFFIPHFASSLSYAQAGPFPKDKIVYVGQITQDEEGKFISYPSYVYVDPVKREVYIIEGRGRILIYNAGFFPLFTLDKNYGIESPQGVMIDARGYLWVAQGTGPINRRGRISLFDPCLKWMRDIYFNGFIGAEEFIPYRLAENSRGEIFVIGTYSPAVVILDSFGNFQGTFFQEEEGEGQRKRVAVNDVLIGPDDRLYLLSEETSHVYVYDAERNFLFKFGQKGGSTGKMSRPQGIGLDKRTGIFFIVDYMRHVVTAYDRKGGFIFEFGGLGWGEGWLQYPKDITVDETGRVFIADLFNNRVQVLQIIAQVLPEKAAEEAEPVGPEGVEASGEQIKAPEPAGAVEGKGVTSIPPVPISETEPKKSERIETGTEGETGK